MSLFYCKIWGNDLSIDFDCYLPVVPNVYEGIRFVHEGQMLCGYVSAVTHDITEENAFYYNIIIDFIVDLNGEPYRKPSATEQPE